MECFRSYFVSKKTGKGFKKWQTVAMFVLFAALMAMISVIFFGMSYLLHDILGFRGAEWIYFAVLGMLAMALGTFGSVFNTFSVLYQAKDNDFLLALPIRPSTILISRLFLVYGLSLFYSGVVWLPAIVSYWIFYSQSVLVVVFEILLLPLIALFVTVLTCALGWVVAIISTKLKHKNFITVIITLVFFAIYYYFCMNVSTFVEKLVVNTLLFGQQIRKWASLFYTLGLAAMGDVASMLLFTLICLVAFAVTFVILTKTFTRIVTATEKVGRKAYKQKAIHARSYRRTLLDREWKRFINCPTYMLNMGLGVILMPLLTAVLIIRREYLFMLIGILSTLTPEIVELLPLAIVAILGLVVTVNAISSPSVSLEGKTLWLVKALPVSSKDILQAKEMLHIVVNVIPLLLSELIIAVVFEQNAVTIALMTLFLLAYLCYTAITGLMIDLLRPNLTWSSEVVPIKQSLNVIFAWLAGFLLLAAIGGLYYLLRKSVSVSGFLMGADLVLILIVALLQYWVNTRGAARFDRL